MLSTKTLATLLLFTLNMQLAASSGTQETRASRIWAFLSKRSKSKPTSKPVLKDETNTTKAVQAAEESTEEVVQVQVQPVPQINERFDELFKQGKHDELFELVERMSQDEFIKQLGLVVKTLEQYNKIVEYLKEHKMVASFYVHGDTNVVKGAILANSSIYNGCSYVDDGDLEAALPLALNNDYHDRVIELLNVRQGITAVEDGQNKLEGKEARFDNFVFWFLRSLAPWEDDMALRRFLALRKNELRTEYSVILDTLCEKLVWFLRDRLDKPKAVSLLTDMIGQPSLLTPVSFTKPFLFMANDKDRSAFIKHGWAEALQEGLKEDYPRGGEYLWRAMKAESRVHRTERFPETEKERAVACKRFPTKRQKDHPKIMAVVAMISSEIGNTESNFIILPTVLWSIVSDYAFSLADIDSTVSRK